LVSLANHHPSSTWSLPKRGIKRNLLIWVAKLAAVRTLLPIQLFWYSQCLVASVARSSSAEPKRYMRPMSGSKKDAILPAYLPIALAWPCQDYYGSGVPHQNLTATESTVCTTMHSHCQYKIVGEETYILYSVVGTPQSDVVGLDHEQSSRPIFRPSSFGRTCRSKENEVDIYLRECTFCSDSH
jgi:hypothetical protein